LVVGTSLAPICELPRTPGRPREIEIWFILCREKFYLFSEQGAAAGWVKNIGRNPNVFATL
jgi:hypothetical protein